MPHPGANHGCRSAAAVLCVALSLLVAPVGAEARYASIVIDAATGQVLEERNADDANRPASLAKMMTLYLAFDALRQGRIAMDTAFPVSEPAASQPPSKLGLIPGESVTVHDLILALITKSANDAAVTLAEGLAGSEPLFAASMTARAQTLGMRHTVFRNASGLPDPDQITSARDIAVLARALWREFPEEYRLFATERFEWRGVVYSNHNTLMAKFSGMDGIKTGYIHESGFNLAASAVRGDRRLIGVVMGGDTAEVRDAHMAGLLEDAFAGRSSDAVVELAARSDGIGRRMMRVIAALSPVGRAEAAPPAKAWAAAFGRFQSKAEAARRAAMIAKRADGRPGVRADGRGKSAAWRALVITENAGRARSVCRIAVGHRWSCAVEDASAVRSR